MGALLLFLPASTHSANRLLSAPGQAHPGRGQPSMQTEWRALPTQTHLRFHRLPWDVALQIWKLVKNLLVAPHPAPPPTAQRGPGTRSGHGLSSLRVASTRIWQKLSVRGLERRSVSRRLPGPRSQLWTGQNVTFPSSHTSLWLLQRGNSAAPGPSLLPLDHWTLRHLHAGHPVLLLCRSSSLDQCI